MVEILGEVAGGDLSDRIDTSLGQFRASDLKVADLEGQRVEPSAVLLDEPHDGVVVISIVWLDKVDADTRGVDRTLEIVLDRRGLRRQCKRFTERDSRGSVNTSDVRPSSSVAMTTRSMPTTCIAPNPPGSISLNMPPHSRLYDRVPATRMDATVLVFRSR